MTIYLYFVSWLGVSKVASLAGIRNVSCSPNVPRTCTTNCANLIEPSPSQDSSRGLTRQTISSYTVYDVLDLVS
jgi:hypothetical protein